MLERCPGVPILLVGLKKDLRDDPIAVEEMRKKSLRFTTQKQGNDMKETIGAKKYLECSSLTGRPDAQARTQWIDTDAWKWKRIKLRDRAE